MENKPKTLGPPRRDDDRIPAQNTGVIRPKYFASVPLSFARNISSGVCRARSSTTFARGHISVNILSTELRAGHHISGIARDRFGVADNAFSVRSLVYEFRSKFADQRHRTYGCRGVRRERTRTGFLTQYISSNKH